MNTHEDSMLPKARERIDVDPDGSRFERSVKTIGIDTDRDLQTSGDRMPPDSEIIEVRLPELQQLFNVMDASPFRERDLDPDAEEFIVGWAREAPRGAQLALLVELNRSPGLKDEPAMLRDAIHGFFLHRAEVSRARLRQLLRVGRISLLVGLGFPVAAVGLDGLFENTMRGQRMTITSPSLSPTPGMAAARPLRAPGD